MEYIILSVKGNAAGVTEGIDGIDGIDASVGRAGRCYHWLKSYADSMLNRKTGLLEEGRVVEDHTMVHLLSKVTQCPQCLKEFKSAKGQNGITAYGIYSIEIIGVIVGLALE